MALINLTSPFDQATARSLNVGERVSLSGTVVTARDQVHKYLAEGHKPPIDLKGLVIYHCGPVTVPAGESWLVAAAGPTTSMREEPYEPYVINTYQPGAIMGKGGMGPATLKAMQEQACVYLHLTGGAAQYIASCIKKVTGVLLPEFGQPEAMWVFEVENLPAIVTMDSHGQSLHRTIEQQTAAKLRQLLG
ncbi:MAG: L(+)-tartrate dehydratase subunit beta [Deltaproteobacteria bacterium ADurb.Bin510]|nr:MAG: L(+)-tartrate dehydratase subunit beta [Deltaproteobacteria bacterium ADurb.Bin510]